MEDRTIATVAFYDYGDKQNGFVVIRRIEGKVSICLSLEENADVEALLDKRDVGSLIEALKAALA